MRMKKYIIPIVMALLCLVPKASAQVSYYYYHGNQITLEVDPMTIVTITQKNTLAPQRPPIGLQLTDTIEDSRNRILVYRRTTSVTAPIQMPSSPSMSVLPCYKSETGELLVPDGYLYVKLRNLSDYPLLQEMAAENDCDIVDQSNDMPLWYMLKASNGTGNNPVDIANTIYESGNFAAAFPSFSYDMLEISYDPNVFDQWGLYNSTNEGMDINVSNAWNYSTGRGIKIAVIDLGIDLTHQDLAANIYPLSYDTETNSSPSKVYGSHGTHCAGIVAAVRNNGLQVAGVAPDAKLMSVSNSLNGGSRIFMLACGINWAWKHGADIISCSWHCIPNEMVENAIDSAVIRGREGKGCIFVKSAGNSGREITFPGNYSPNVIAVANMKADGTRNPNSSHGDNLLVIAPGTDILSTVPDNQIGLMSGTSMACPHVAGLAALILERNPRLTAAKVREIIARNTKKVGDEPYSVNKPYGTWNEFYGYGLIDAFQAVINTPRN